MVIHLTPELEAAVNAMASQQGVTPDVMAMNALRERFLVPRPTVQARDDWERRLLGLATHCGVSLPDSSLRREVLYE